MIGSEYTPAQTRGQERWRVIDEGCRYYVEHPSAAFIGLNQYGGVTFAHGLRLVDTDLGTVLTIAARLQDESPVKRHGTAHSEARRLLCQRFADALNAVLGA